MEKKQNFLFVYVLSNHGNTQRGEPQISTTSSCMPSELKKTTTLLLLLAKHHYSNIVLSIFLFTTVHI